MFFTSNRKHWWFSGRILACHAGGPGSIPGQCKLLSTFVEVSSQVIYFSSDIKIIASNLMRLILKYFLDWPFIYGVPQGLSFSILTRIKTLKRDFTKHIIKKKPLNVLNSGC